MTDASGSVLPSVAVHLSNKNTGTSSTVQTNSEGQYRFLLVDPGNYSLTADASGFQKYVQQNITLSVSQASTIDVHMTVGSAEQTIEVTSNQQLLETEKSDRGVVLPTRQLEELPIYVRNPVVLVEIVPGVIQETQRFDLTPFTNNGNSQFAFNGITGDATENLLHGAPNDMIYQGLNSIAYIPSVDSVSEFKAITAPYDAQYGRSGDGVISVATKSGTNSFHGTTYDFVQRTFLNSNTYQNNAANQPKSDSSLDEYGFTVGGPIVIPHVYNGRDKTFFFGGWEGYKQNTNLATGISVPTAAQRAGDFSQTLNPSGQLVTIYNPYSGRNVNGTWTRDPFPGNKIPASMMDPVGKALASLYPLPNSNQNARVNWQSNYYSPSITTYSFNNIIGRVDHTFSDKEKVYARYAWNSANISQNSNLLTSAAIDSRVGTNTNTDVMADSVTVLTPNPIFDAKFSLTRSTQNFLPPDYGSFDATQIGWPAATVAQFQEKPQFPYITLTASPASNFPNLGGTAQYQYMGSSSGNIYSLRPQRSQRLRP